MAEIDPVILQLRADTDAYIAKLRSTTRTADEQLGIQERKIKQLEAEFKSSSSDIAGALRSMANEIRANTRVVNQQLTAQEKQIKRTENQFEKSTGGMSNSLRGIAGALAAAFTGRELIGLLDSFTRLQNSLRVAGLEGQALAGVQNQLLDLSGRYGVSIEELASLYGRSAQAASDLGASESQLLQVTEASAQALKITGTSAVQAQGALLGLVQALASGTVRAEEFNQINEGGLRPLLQVAANTERFGGSVAKLRIAVTDGKLSSQEFFNAILAGSAELEGRASKATLTLSGAFEALSSQLVVYFGEAGQASGVTAALASAIQSLANNLDRIIPALATIGIFMGARLAAPMALAVRNAIALRAVSIGLAASLGGVSGAAALTGRALLGAFGGPVVAALLALGAGIVYLAQRTDVAGRATDAYRIAQESAADANQRSADLALRLATAHGRVRAEALAAAKAERENAKQKLASAQASAILAQAELARLQAFKARSANSVGLTDPRFASQAPSAGADQAIANTSANLAASFDTINSLLGTLSQLDSAISGAALPGVANVAAPGGGGSSGGGNGGAGRTGPSLAEVNERFQSERAALMQQYNSAMRAQATTAEEAAEFESRNLELARIRSAAAIKADADYSDAQKTALLALVDELAEVERRAVELAERAEIERNAQDLADERARAEADGLRLQYELADTQDERRAIALQILEAEDRYLTSKLEAVLASEAANEAEKERARIALAALQSTRGQREEAVTRSESGALDRYIRSLSDPKARAEEVVVRQLERVNDGITDAISKALGTDDPLIKDLLGILLEEVLLKPIAAALQNAQGGGGGGGFLSSIGTALGSLFGGGRASGGFTAPGKLYRVNEGASPGRVEGFMPTGSGKIIPLGQMNVAQGGGQSGGVVVVRLALSGDIDAKIDQRAAGVAVEVVRQGAPQIIDAAANETQRRFSRPSL